jgi:hypothetical protein
VAVMIVLAVAHVGFWAWALTLGVQAGVTGAAGTGLVTAWLALMASWTAFVGRLSRSGWLAGLALPFLIPHSVTLSVFVTFGMLINGVRAS